MSSAVLVPKAPDPNKDRRTRRLTAGLSAVGAGAGALGLGVGAKEVLAHGWRGTPRLTRALIPAEIAGLGGELMATKILHGDTKRQGIQKGHGMDCSASQRGRRIREPAKGAVERRDQREEGIGKAAGSVLARVAKAPAPRSNELAAIKSRALSSLTHAMHEKGTIIRPVGKAAAHPKADGIADMGIDGAFHGQAAASHLERAKLHRQRGDQLHMEAIEEESALKRRQAQAHLRQAALLESSAKLRTGAAVRSLGLSEGMGAAGIKSGGGSEKTKVSKARLTAAERRRLPDSAFAIPSRRAYPINDPAHARNALARVNQAGTSGSPATIERKVARKYPSIGKARTFDPESDRQRRLGSYAGLAGGAALVTGETARRQYQVTPAHTLVRGRGAAQKRIPVGRSVGFVPGRGRLGIGLTAATAGLAGLGAAAYRRGVSERNRRTWD